VVSQNHLLLLIILLLCYITSSTARTISISAAVQQPVTYSAIVPQPECIVINLS